MSMTEVDLDTQIEELRESLRTISPEVVAGDKQAKTKAAEIKKQIASLEEDKQLRADAAIEEQRRAEHEALIRDNQARDAARKEFAHELEAVVEVEKEIADLMTKLGEKAQSYREGATRMGRFAARAADPSINVPRGRLEKRLSEYLSASVSEMLRDRGPLRPIESLATNDAAWLEKVKASLGAALAPRPVRAQPKQPADPREALFFRAPRVNGRDAPPSVFISPEGEVTRKGGPGGEITNTDFKNARTVFEGGRQWTEVKSQDVEPLLAAGFKLRKGLVLPTGAYQLTNEFIEKGDTDASSAK